MKKSITVKILATIVLFLFINYSKVYSQQNAKGFNYESAPNDPLNSRIYKLSNGLTVYMTVYKNAPRIQTYIAVRAGSKNDPNDATGLAHYLEHMLFKGTDKYGSKDYVKEKEQLDKIEKLYELYRKTTDEKQRDIIYHQIDSVSGYASKFAIANEYDKMLSNIGAKGTNAYTWLEQTVYVNDIPSNQLDKWTTTESERFRNPVMRLFHTELEAVYEEKNRNLDSDDSKSFEALFLGLFPNNTYGSQTTIGKIEHLKNPSLLEIKNYFNTYYVPNNMAICLSGDFDPEATIKLIDKKFGSWKSKPVPAYVPYFEKPIATPVIKELIGPDAENIIIGYRFEGTGSKDADMIILINKILSNGQAGLIDLNLNQGQKVLDAGGFQMAFKDYSAHIIYGSPKEGQSLDDLKYLLLEQIEKIKAGDFPEWLLEAIVTDLKLEQTKTYERNSSRAEDFVSAFITDTKWQNYINTIDRISKISKQEVIDFVKAKYKNNYVIVYKRNGEDINIKKVVKPAINPVEVNRNDQSPFLKELINTPTKDIEPVFIDYNKDIEKFNFKTGIEVLYKSNTENKTFDLYYVINMGTNHNKKLEVAINYLKYLGTKDLSSAALKQEFYKLGCSFDVYIDKEQVWVTLNGLTENFEKAVKLFETLLDMAQPNAEALKNLVSDIIKKREDAKLNKREILFNGMFNYGKYGKSSPFTNILSNEELKKLTPEELITIINELNSFQHKIFYYGSGTKEELAAVLEKFHKAPSQLKSIPEPTKFVELDENTDVFIVDYDMKQAEVILFSKDEKYNKENASVIRMFNEYFGEGMSSVVFQEMRESKALAYSVYCSYIKPSKKEDYNYVFSYIGTQADKLPEAMTGMFELINNMPESENNFKASKEAILQIIRSERITKASVLFNYEKDQKLGLDYDIRKDIFKNVPNLKLSDIKTFEQNHFKNKKYTILVIGKKENLDMKIFEKHGKVTFLSLQDIFGY